MEMWSRQQLELARVLLGGFFNLKFLLSNFSMYNMQWFSGMRQHEWLFNGGMGRQVWLDKITYWEWGYTWDNYRNHTSPPETSRSVNCKFIPFSHQQKHWHLWKTSSFVIILKIIKVSPHFRWPGQSHSFCSLQVAMCNFKNIRDAADVAIATMHSGIQVCVICFCSFPSSSLISLPKPVTRLLPIYLLKSIV